MRAAPHRLPVMPAAIRFVIATVIVLALGLTLGWAPALASEHPSAGDDVTPSSVPTTLGQDPEGGGMIPEPNSGRAPEDAGDRGGALQTALFFGILGGIGMIAFFIVRESRRVRADRGF